MKLSFHEVRMTLVNVNARSELHGDERQPAGDLKLSASLANDVLDKLHPGLKRALYWLDKSREADLADQGSASQEDFMPHLRFPSLSGGFKWSEELSGASVSLEAPGVEPLHLSDVKVAKIEFEPKDGGTVEFGMRLQVHPDERQFGKLCTLSQVELLVTLEPAAEVQEA